MKLIPLPGQTTLENNEWEGLIPKQIVLERELREFEMINISKAIAKYLSPRARQINLCDPLTIRQIHRDMFDDTWEWAGQFRKTGKIIGVPPEKIANELDRACRDLGQWLKEETYSIEEIAIRFHHRLLWIHLFPNGNGRHARLVADVLLHSREIPLFTWGSGNLNSGGPERMAYLSGLKKADIQNVSDLIALSRK